MTDFGKVYQIVASRSCFYCGWTLPDDIGGYSGDCPQCYEEMVARSDGREPKPICPRFPGDCDCNPSHAP